MAALSSETGWWSVGNGVNAAAMHRLFVALRPPPAMRERLLATMEGVPGARWQSDEQLHLTLRFIGEVDRHQAEDVAAALGNVRHPPVAFALAGVGSFLHGGRGALWAGVAPQDDLRALHRSVESACRRAGVQPAGRAFHPHVTLARFSRGAGPVEPFLERWAGLAGAPATIDCMTLFESGLGGEGAAYDAVARYPLSG